MAVVTAIGNGPVILGLLGSYIIYKERLTLYHTGGSLLCLTGILILALSVGVGKDDNTEAGGVTVESETKAKAMRILLIDAFSAMLMFGIRIVMGKYLTRILSPLQVIKLGFTADFCCGAFVIILSSFKVIKIPISTYFEPEMLLFAGVCGLLNCGAEMMVFMALNEGLTGPVSAVISFNAAFVSVLTWVIQGIALTTLQILGVIVALAGVLTVSLSP